MSDSSDTAAVGLRVKSGYATLVLLAGSASEPRVADRRRIELSDPARPESRQPFHATFGTARTDRRSLDRLIHVVERCTHRSVADAIHEYQAKRYLPLAAGLVVGSDIDPATIANPHIRAHASEGRLFRRVATEALEGAGLTCSAWIERRLYADAAERLGRTETEVKRVVAELGRGIAGGWRADDKAAALAALLALSGAYSNI